MGFLPKNLFGKQDKVQEPQKEIFIEPLTARPKPVRGPNGKFVSTKKTAEKPKEAPVIIPTLSQTPQSKQATLTFFGKPVRVTKDNGSYFFELSDILSLCLDPHVFSKFEALDISELEIDKGLTADKAIHLIQMIELPFPGPLSRWLKEISIE